MFVTSTFWRNMGEAALCVALCGILTSGSAALRTQEELAEKVVRLHVIAASDSEEDQAVKLLVRDAVRARTEELLRGATDRTEAENRLRAALPELKELADAVLVEQASPDRARAELREMEFPTRTYDGYALPAGRYLALRIVIGSGGGRNWWCVVFPPLCTTPVSMDGASAFTTEELRLITEADSGYVLKFKTVELWEHLRQTLSEKIQQKAA